jgi:hypothetical protein
MLNRLMVLILIILLNCKEYSNQEGIKNSNKTTLKRCIYASSNYKTIEKLKNYFNINFDKVEEQGIDFYFLFSDNELEFLFSSLSKPLRVTLVKIDETIFQTVQEKAYLGLKYDIEDKKNYIWLEKDKKKLFKQFEMIGSEKIGIDNCLDPIRILKIYKDRKREVEYGPVPTGDY